jgi:hydrogenase maturation protein HypF
VTRHGCDLLIRGFVQGQGVRPALARLAIQRGWSGSVRNHPQGVLLRLCGEQAPDFAEAAEAVRTAHPALAAAVIEPCPAGDAPHESAPGFRIDESETIGPLDVPVPRDAAICETCLAETRDPGSRRYRYGLTSCAQCGPRYSIVLSMPFDRARTTLSTFPLCARCRAEYLDPDDRRCHAQTIGCPNCGPQVWAEDARGNRMAAGDPACLAATWILREGKTVALRGIGGYQLLVDATNAAAVARLRARKRRRAKPFAVLCRDLAEAAALGRLDECARRELLSPANPIVVVRRNRGAALADGIHLGLEDVGLMLPTTAVHDRLLELTGVPLVCTSGNVEGRPLCVDVAEARRELAELADLFLHHDRPIAQPIDDSVVRPIAGQPVTIRAARGLAPLPLACEPPASNTVPIVALGAYQKAALAWTHGRSSAAASGPPRAATLGPHLGDLDDLDARRRWQAALAGLLDLHRISPADAVWAVDAHPDDWARRAVPPGAPAVTVWHHHAHIAAGMLEHGLLDREVLGLAADGQGYGPDGTLWGGEVLHVRRGSFRRLARVRPFALVGGERAVVQPQRVAASLLSQLDASTLRPPCDAAFLRAAHAGCTPWTSSLGRLFDGVAALVLGIEHADHPGEPAAQFEALCDPRAEGSYRWALDRSVIPAEIDWRPMLTSLLDDLDRQTPLGVAAERFHRGVADWMLEQHAAHPALPVVVGGGVFQNRRLCELLVERWPAAGSALHLPGRVPPNDGGLAAGQLAVAVMRHATRG